MGGFLTVIGIGLYYWVDKYNLLRRSSIKENISGKLSIKALTLLDLVLIFMPLGQIIFDHFLRNLVEVLQNSLIDFFQTDDDVSGAGLDDIDWLRGTNFSHF